MKDTTAKKVWKDACQNLRGILQPDVFERWIEVIEAGELVDNCLTLVVDNDYYQGWLEENYVPLIRTALTAVSGSEIDIAFRVRPHSLEMQESEPGVRRKSPSKNRKKRKPPAPLLNPKFTFESFIVGPSNNFAHGASLAVAKAPAKAYNPLFIYGGVGLGKTHLMQGIGHHVLSKDSDARVTYVTLEQFLNEYIDGLTQTKLTEFRRRYRQTDVLLIDDIHFLARKERLQEEFFHTFNALFDAHKQIVMISDRPASEITGLEQRLVSRFEWGLVVELELPDLETRVAILRKKQQETNTKLPDELLFFIAENIRANVRRLEGALVRAVSYSSLTNKELSVDSLRHLLRDTLDQEQEDELTFKSIQRAVADHFDVRISDMNSKRRPRAVAVPRQVAMYLCRKLTSSSLPEIAGAFDKTHATVLHAYKVIESRMDVDVDLRQSVSHISRRLGRPTSLAN